MIPTRLWSRYLKKNHNQAKFLEVSVDTDCGEDFKRDDNSLYKH